MMALVALCDFLVLSGASGASSLAAAPGVAKPKPPATSVLSVVSPASFMASHAMRLGEKFAAPKSVAGEAVTGGVSIHNLGRPVPSTPPANLIALGKHRPAPTTTTTTVPAGKTSAPSTTTTTDPPTTTTSTTRPAPTTTTTTDPPTTTTSTTRPATTTTTTTKPPATTTTTQPPATTTTTTQPAPTTTTTSTTTTTTQPAPTTTTTTSTTSTTTTTTTQPSSSRPAGLIQAGDSKVTCITDEPGQQLVQDAAYTGVTYNCVETYTDADTTWSDWTNPWIASPNQPFVPWVEADPTQHSLIDTQNLIPDDVASSDPNWAADCAAGDYNTYAQEFATAMVNAGLGYTVIRLGHEMNGTWYTDSLGTTVTSWQQWGECFAQEVTAMRSVPGAHFLFDWCVNANYRDIPLADFYPGNAYVDIIGIDFYDQTGLTIPAVGQPGRFQALASEPLGLDAVEAFAAANDKPLSIPEWGTVSTQGDDPAYVTAIGNFVAANDVAYQAWFNAGDDNIYQLNPAQDPLSVAAYTAAFAS